MFQPEVKFEFVRRYCSPDHGWTVFLDIDASEMGRTGGERKTPESKARQLAMRAQGAAAKEHMIELGITVGGNRRAWFDRLHREHECCRALSVPGDRDIVAVHPGDKRLIIAEVEGVSSGQPEMKLYKAIGQIVMAVSEVDHSGFDASFVIVVHGDGVGEHLKRASALDKLGICGVQLTAEVSTDRWFVGEPLRSVGGSG